MASCGDHCRIRNGALRLVIAAFAKLAVSTLELLRTNDIKRCMVQFHLSSNSAARLSAKFRQAKSNPSGQC